VQIFNLGFGEVFFILLIAVIVLGPERIVVSSRRAGKWIRTAASNPLWRDILATSRELREIPNQLMEESGLRDDLNEIQSGFSEAGTAINRELEETRDDLSRFDSTSFSPAGAGGLNELPASASLRDINSPG
jgi:Sec-independent protein translocase protein TatA